MLLRNSQNPTLAEDCYNATIGRRMRAIAQVSVLEKEMSSVFCTAFSYLDNTMNIRFYGINYGRQGLFISIGFLKVIVSCAETS